MKTVRKSFAYLLVLASILAPILGAPAVHGQIVHKKSFLAFNGSQSIAAAPTVTATGTTGSTSYSYKVVAHMPDLSTTTASAAGTTSTGNATLSATNYNAVSWTAVTGAQFYDVYRTASSGTPSSTGKIGSPTTNSLNDVGLTGDGTTAPTSSFSTIIQVGDATTLQLSAAVTATSGTSPTLDCKIQDTLDNGVNWFDVAGTPITQVTTSNSSQVTVASRNFGGKIRVVVTLGGTSPVYSSVVVEVLTLTDNQS